jgi:AcrR family transcriptional regulator
MARPSGREGILEAAERVVLRDGAAHLTLDAVAVEAGMSKGGVLYHFPNKSALLVGMLERLFEGYEARREEKLAEYGDAGDGAALLAELDAALDPSRNEKNRQVGSAILAALANEPALIAQGREFHARRFARCCGADLADLEKVMVLLALDGIKLLELLQVSPFNAKQRMRIEAHILAEGRRVTGA